MNSEIQGTQSQMFPVPELPEPAYRGWVGIDRRDFYKAARRVTPIQFLMMMLIIDRTRSAPKIDGKRPGWAELDLPDFEALTGRSQRSLARAMAGLEHKKAVIREAPDNATRKGRYRLDMSVVTSLALPAPRPPRHRPRSKPIEAHVAAPSQVAALYHHVSATYGDLPEASDGRTKGEQSGDTPICASPESTSYKPILPFLSEHRAPQNGEQQANPTTKLWNLAAIAASGGLPNAAVFPILPSVAALAAAPKMAESPEATKADQKCPSILPELAGYSANFCPWGWKCPLIDNDLTAENGAPSKALKENLDIHEEIVVSESVSTDSPTNRSQVNVREPEGELSARQFAVLSALPKSLLKSLGDFPSTGLLDRIDRALAGADIADFQAKVNAKVKSGYRWTSINLLERLAKDVGAAWQREQQLTGGPRSQAGDDSTRVPAGTAAAAEDGEALAEARIDAVIRQMPTAEYAKRLSEATKRVKEEWPRLPPAEHKRIAAEVVRREIRERGPA